MDIEGRGSPERTRLDEMMDVIRNAADAIEEEFNRTANTWLACFGSCVFQVETYLSSPKTQAFLSPEKYQQAERRLDDLKQKLFDLKQEFPEKRDIPPDGVKQELLLELDILREE